MTRKQRTPEELIIEVEERLSALRVRQAKQDALANPALAPIVAALELVRKQIREAKKGLGTGPQSFDARVAKHEAWIDRIEGERTDAVATLETAEEEKANLESQLAEAVKELTASDNTNSASAEA